MGSHSGANRRRFLTSGGAPAAFVFGAIKSVSGQTPTPAPHDPQRHRLMVHGMVSRPLTYTMDELRRFPSVSRILFLECNANSRPLRGPNRESVQLIHGRTSTSEWT